MNSKLWIIIKEVYRKNVKSWAFVMMVLMPIIMSAVIAGIGYYIGKEKVQTSVGNIAVINADENVKAALKEGVPDNNYTFDINEEDSKKMLADNKIDGYLVISKNVNKYHPEYYRKPTSKDIDTTKLESAFETLQLNELTQSLGLNKNQISEIKNNKVSINTVKIQMEKDGTVKKSDSNMLTESIKKGVAYVVTFILFLFIMNYVTMISQEIAAEKGSRLMEIILSSVSATTHFFGKMIGIVFVIITQMLIYFGLWQVGKVLNNKYHFLGNLGLGEGFSLGTFLGSMKGDLLIYGLYMITGILIYTAIAGFLGSLVSKTEDVQKMIAPLTFVGVGGFYIGMFALTSPNSPFVKLTSQIPFFTPFVMPFRLAAGTVPTFELVISIVISVLFMILALWISAIFYKSNVLTYSDKGLINNFKRSYQLYKSEKNHK